MSIAVHDQGEESTVQLDLARLNSRLRGARMAKAKNISSSTVTLILRVQVLASPCRKGWED